MTYNEHLEVLKGNPDLVAENPDVFGKTATPPNNRRVVAKMTTQAQKPTGETGRRTKYGNTRTEYDGVVYDSAKEASVAAELDLAVKAGDITYWLRQVGFRLPGGIVYRADFVTFKGINKNNATYANLYHVCKTCTLMQIEVIEVKGIWSAEAKLKLKLFRATYPKLTIRIK